MVEYEPPSNRDKDVIDNDDRPPPRNDRSVHWDFICFGFRPRSMESRILDVFFDKYRM